MGEQGWGGGVLPEPAGQPVPPPLPGTTISHPSHCSGLICAAYVAHASCPTKTFVSMSTPMRLVTHSSSGACSAATAPAAGPRSRCGIHSLRSFQGWEDQPGWKAWEDAGMWGPEEAATGS